MRRMLQSRREFLKTTSAGMLLGGWLAGTQWTLGAGEDPASWRKQSPNDKLNIGIIGVNNRAKSNINGVKGENIVALCDVDSNYLAEAKKNFEKADTYSDFRKLLERNDLDAVVVSTADHTHAPAAALALRRGLHVYCEKPLTHSVFEARTLAELAAKNKRVTQMGTQIHAGGNYRRVVELVQSGAIGGVKDVHVWCGKGWSNGRLISEVKPAPANLDWDLWQGPVAARSFQPGIHPANWRKFWDYGGGTLGDMGCHYIDLPFWALKLRHPNTVEADGPPVHPEGTPDDLHVHWEFPAREEMPACSLHWYDGSARPKILADIPMREDAKGKKESWGNGVLFIGEKGMLLADYGRYRLLPDEQFKDFTPPEKSIPDSIGHYNEWINAIKTGTQSLCNFDYSGALTETILLGNVAFRAGEKFTWDAANLKPVNCPRAESFIRREYRKGWEL
jgi:predicted dehydrogenase